MVVSLIMEQYVIIGSVGFVPETSLSANHEDLLLSNNGTSLEA
jgi:hypothetical protein